MEADGVELSEMAARVRRRPGTVRRLLEHGDRLGSTSHAAPNDPLRPIERVVIDAIGDGQN